MKPEFMVYHESDSLSRLHFKVPTAQLTYAVVEREAPRQASVRLHYNLYPNFNSTNILDSATVLLRGIEQETTGDFLIGEFPFRAKGDATYVLEIMAEDVFRGQNHTEYIRIDKMNLISRQNFLLTSLATELPLFSYYLNDKTPVLIQHRSPQKVAMEVRYYNREFGLAPPPFSMYNPRPFQYEADSTAQLQPVDSGWIFTPGRAGFYHLLMNSQSKTGLTLFAFKGNFPELKQVDELVEPLRFITSKKEYTNIITAANPKDALDAFWLDNTINQERARELIKQFYSRVESANRYFSCHKAGWQTDRGMVFMIFGPPNVTYRNTSTETWIYGEENNFMSLTFNFTRVNNPFSDNDYLLNRSPVYKNAWYRAVDSWRQGRVFTQ